MIGTHRARWRKNGAPIAGEPETDILLRTTRQATGGYRSQFVVAFQSNAGTMHVQRCDGSIARDQKNNIGSDDATDCRFALSCRTRVDDAVGRCPRAEHSGARRSARRNPRRRLRRPSRCRHRCGGRRDRRKPSQPAPLAKPLLLAPWSLLGAFVPRIASRTQPILPLT